MSLVDYCSSSEGEEDDKVLREEDSKDEPKLPKLPKHDILYLPQNQRSGLLLSNEQLKSVSSSTTSSSMDKLPDASFLLNSPTFPSTMASGSDHSSRVAAAMAESSSRKRVANGPTSSFPRGKVPRGRVTHTKNVPDTVGGLLVPPQVKGRSNVVTEDIGKLFVRRLSDPSSQ